MNALSAASSKTETALQPIEANSPRIKVIRADDRLQENVFAALHNLFKEIWLFREQIWTVLHLDFRAAYYGSGLGMLWNYILPIVPLTIYIMLGFISVFPDFNGVDGTTYRAFGITLWFLLAGCIQTPIQTVQSRNKDVMKTAFPLSAAIVSAFARLIFDTLVRTTFVVVVIAATMSWPVWTVLALPLILLPALLLFIGFGLLFGVLNVIYRDVSRIVSIFLQYGIFVSGVIFPLNSTPILSTLNLVNPFAIFIDASRGVVFQGRIENPFVFISMVLVSVVVFLMACRIFYVMEYRVRGIN